MINEEEEEEELEERKGKQTFIFLYEIVVISDYIFNVEDPLLLLLTEIKLM